MAAAPPRGPIDILERTVNDVLIHAGKLIRAQAKQNQRLTGISATKLAEEHTAFNAILDSVESDIVRAKSTLLRDLQQVRARKSAAAAAAEAATTAPQDTPQASLTAIDDKGDQPENSMPTATTAENDNAPSQAAVNMDLDPPATTSTPAAATPNVNTAPTPSHITQPSPMTANRDKLSQSPQWTTKPAPAPSPAMKAASPILIKSATTSPAVERASIPRPQTPSAATAAAGSNASRAIPLSASTSPSVKTESPVLMKKNASPAAKTIPATNPPPVPVTSTAAPTSAAYVPTTAAPPTTTSEARAAPAGVSGDVTMDDIFALTGPSSSGGPGHAELGFTDKQFTLVPDDEQSQTKEGQEQQQQQQQDQQQQDQQQQDQQQQDQQWQQDQLQQEYQQQQQQQPPGLPQQPEAQMQPPPAPLQQPSEAEFDVEKFAADAAQNLMTDSAFSSAPAAPATTGNLDGQAQLQAGQQAGSGLDGNGLGSLVDNEDDLFKYIDDNMDALGDTSTSFDELYGTTDTVDLDDFFDT